MKIKIHPCRENQIDELQKVSYETYKKMNSYQTMEAYLTQSFSKDKLFNELSNPASMFFLMYLDNSLIGYIKLNEAPSQTDINDSEGLELERIYIYKQYNGKGYGKELIKFCLEKAAALKKSYVWLGVWKKNEDAITFYKKLGFEIIGEHSFRMENEIQLDYIMKKQILNR